jgi:3-oxoacyl-[acyl-carrier protein] reductase
MMRSAQGIDEQYIAGLPLKRLGLPQDIASAIVYLASDEASYFCGQVLSPNGGIAM